MVDQSFDFERWQQTAPGRYLIAWEQQWVDLAVVNAFGYYAFQLGLTDIDYLQANRMALRCIAALPATDLTISDNLRLARLVLEPHFLPFQANHIDLLVYPHVLEHCANPMQALREAERVLVPEGKLVICGFNPYGYWGIRQRWASVCRWMGIPGPGFAAITGHPIALWRLKDWLTLLGFEVEAIHFGGHRSILRSNKVNGNLSDRVAGVHPFRQLLGQAYVVVANKKVPGMRLISPSWHGKAVTIGPVGQTARVKDKR